MNKIFKYLLLGVMAVCFTAPVAAKVEAAKIAVVPLIVNVKDDGGMNAILYSDACAKLFKYPDFDFVDTDLVKKAAAAQTDVFSKAGMLYKATLGKGFKSGWDTWLGYYWQRNQNEIFNYDASDMNI